MTEGDRVYDVMREISTLADAHPIRSRLEADPGRLLHPFFNACGKLNKAIDAAEMYEPTKESGRIARSGHDAQVRALFGYLNEQTDSIIQMAKVIGADSEWPDVFKDHRKIWNGIKHLDRGIEVVTHLVTPPDFEIWRTLPPMGPDRKLNAIAVRSAHISGVQEVALRIIAKLKGDVSQWAESAQTSDDVPLTDVLKFLDYPISKVGDYSRNHEAICWQEVAETVAKLRECLLRLEYNESTLYELKVAEAGLEMWRKSMEEAWPEGSASFLIMGLRQTLDELRSLASDIDAYIEEAADV